jgi:hypothetical protein
VDRVLNRNFFAIKIISVIPCRDLDSQDEMPYKRKKKAIEDLKTVNDPSGNFI